jgi:hypothetical protein
MSEMHQAHRESTEVHRGAEPTANPFSTRHVRPGAIPFVFPPGLDAGGLVSRLAANQWRGEIVGPHGSGKSTLLATLQPSLARAGREPLLVTLHDGERSLRAHRALLSRAHEGTIVIIDGYEQLAPWSKWRLRRYCRRRRAGLVVTAHQPAGLPTLATTTVDSETAAAVFRLLVPGGGPVDRTDLAAALARHSGNLREALFDLYDLYELRRVSGQ